MTIQQKNRSLIIGFFLMLLVAYQFSFKKTIALKTNLTKLSQEQELLSNAMDRMAYLQQENNYLDSILLSNDVSVNESFEHYFVQKITQLKKQYNVDLISYEKPHSYNYDGTIVLSYRLELKGEFRNLMLFTNDIEKLQMGAFTVVSFKKKKRYRPGEDELLCTLILQKVSK